MTCLFIFRRDLRTFDNTGLIYALKTYKKVIPLFIFSKNQVSSKNTLRSSNSIQFMIDSLIDLDSQIKTGLWVDYGDEIEVIEKVMKVVDIDAICFNDDYTPYSKQRDVKIAKYCKSHKISLHVLTDSLLVDNNDIKANNGNTYYVYNLFYNKAQTYPVRKPMKNMHTNYLTKQGVFKTYTLKKIIKHLVDSNYFVFNDQIAVRGGTHAGNRILAEITKGKFRNYIKRKDTLSMNTTMLSAHLKFGTVSIRKVYEVVGSGELRKKIYWRDYYYYLAINDPRFYDYVHLTKNTNNKYKLWDNDKTLLKAWKEGRTGFPVIDAAMREMNTTGYMHNRARMLVSEFLGKILLVDWKYGEKYFTTQLVDIDRAQNMGNWNWSSSFGLDASPYLRIFNPWTQSKKFDADCKYIKHWVPELRNVPDGHIHKWYKYYQDYDVYLEPIVDYEDRRKTFTKRYKAAFK